MYLNYDGKGGRFGETAVGAASADQGKLAVYAAERASDKALTLVAVNRTGDDLTSKVAVKGRDGGATAQVYRYGAADTSAVRRDADVQAGAEGFTGTFPANSISTVVIPAGAGPPPSPSPSPSASPSPTPATACTVTYTVTNQTPRSRRTAAA
ncbi:hypothetical protein AB0O28_21105 [Microbispora sp. NPDC088329]|uniref:hypothetical protein n=1 Tax=Microbispora sp. NPDC088329 TaxID=3154869 RepID=UPI00342A1D7B